MLLMHTTCPQASVLCRLHGKGTQTHLQAKDACASRDEVASIVISVEPNEVSFEDSSQDFLAHRQGAIDL